MHCETTPQNEAKHGKCGQTGDLLWECSPHPNTSRWIYGDSEEEAVCESDNTLEPDSPENQLQKNLWSASIAWAVGTWCHNIFREFRYQILTSTYWAHLNKDSSEFVNAWKKHLWYKDKISAPSQGSLVSQCEISVDLRCYFKTITFPWDYSHKHPKHIHWI